MVAFKMRVLALLNVNKVAKEKLSSPKHVLEHLPAKRREQEGVGFEAQSSESRVDRCKDSIAGALGQLVSQLLEHLGDKGGHLSIVMGRTVFSKGRNVDMNLLEAACES